VNDFLQILKSWDVSPSIEVVPLDASRRFHRGEEKWRGSCPANGSFSEFQGYPRTLSVRPWGGGHHTKNRSRINRQQGIRVSVTMRFITNGLFFLSNVSAMSSVMLATLHPRAQVRRGLTLKAGTDSVDGQKAIQDLLKEMKSIKVGITSAMEDVEAMTEGDPLAIMLREMKSLKKEISSSQASTTEISKEALQEMKSLKADVSSTNIALTDIKDLLRDGVKMRRIEFAVAHHTFQKILDPVTLDILDPRGFTLHYNIDGDLCGSPFDFNSFVVSTLYSFLGSKGVELPDDVLYDEDFSELDEEERREALEDLDEYEIKQKRMVFYNVTMNHLHILLGSKPRKESGKDGSTIMFFDWV
jgi:hypothetical protein